MRIVDSRNRIRLLDREITLSKKEAYGPYFSVFPLGKSVEKFNIEGAKYPLKNHKLTAYDSLCVSNAFAEEAVRSTFPEGIVILMETREERRK